MRTHIIHARRRATWSQINLKGKRAYYQCKLCSATMDELSAIRLHARKCNETSICDQCGQTFNSSDIKGHQRICLDEHDTPVFECHDCGKKYRHKKSLRYHMHEHFNFPMRIRYIKKGRKSVKSDCPTCGVTMESKQLLEEHMATHGDRPYQCSLCPKTYKDRHGLGWHYKVQHDQTRQKYMCELCGKTYPFDCLLTQHMNVSHAPYKTCVCDICGRNISKSYLAVHRRTHSDKGNQYSCQHCGRTFLEKPYLKRHLLIHSGEKPYTCTTCGRRFRQHSTLTSHFRTHTGDRPYKCSLCNNAYKTQNNLKKHFERSGHKPVTVA